MPWDVCGHHQKGAASTTMTTTVEITMALGNFRVCLHEDRAPNTCAYFLRHVNQGLLTGTSVFRIVTLDNQEPRSTSPIEVIQWGFKPDSPSPVAPIALETTRDTGLAHLRWTISTARFAPNYTYGSFFICMRNEPALDFGGARNPDGLGFAAFGWVSAGFETLETIFTQAEAGEFLQHEIAILAADPIGIEEA